MSSPTPPEDLVPGALIADRFRLGPLIGRGGMADVWQATDERLHRTVAIKVLRQDPTSPDSTRLARQRFRDEGRLAARQVHRNIVAVFDAGTFGGRAYLVMEHLDGGTLQARLAEGPLSDHDAAQMATEVLAALEAAHQAGVVHRDIKPSNILRDGDGQWKVADFGIAKSHDAGAVDDIADLTLTGQVIGTPRYMAPERLAGQPATAASDLFSVGVVLHQSLEGRPDADPALLQAATHATSIDPADRYASARSMADAIAVSAERATVALPLRPVAPGLDPTQVDATALAPAAPNGTDEEAGAWPLIREEARRRPVFVAFALVLLVGALAAAAVGGDGRSTNPQSNQVVASTTDAPTTSVSTTTTQAPTTTTTPPTTEPPAPEAKPKGKEKKEKKEKDDD